MTTTKAKNLQTGMMLLFTGPRGCGKSKAAKRLAEVFRMDLYRIDMSQIVDKYIGETAARLDRVLALVDVSATIALFDLADPLLGQGAEVNGGDDRPDNLDIAFLLSRLEEYDGMVILTTNRKDDIDPAFIRRVHCAVDFPLPDSEREAELWRDLSARRDLRDWSPGLRPDRD